MKRSRFLSAMNVKTKVFLLQLIIILTPFFLLNTYQYNKSKDYFEDKQRKVLDIKTHEVSNQLAHYQDEVRSYAVILSKSEKIRETVNKLKNLQSWDDNDQRVISNYPNSDYSLVTPQDYNIDFVRLRDVARENFQSLNKEHEYIGNIEIVNKNIVVVMRGHRDKRGDIKTDQLIKDAIVGKSSSGILVSKRTGQPAIDGAAPITFDGEIVGAIKVGMYITAQVALDIEQLTQVKFINFDQNTVVLTSKFSDNNRLIKQLNEFEKFDVLAFDQVDAHAPKIKMDQQIYNDYIAQGQPYSKLYSSTENNSYAVNIVPIKDYAGAIIGAYMVALNNNELIDDIAIKKNEFIQTMIWIVILALLISFVFSHQIGNPIVYFGRQLREMRESNSVRPIENIFGSQELIDMAFEFNRLIDTLAHHKETNKKLQAITNYDGLTNLLNHQKFHQDIKRLVKQEMQFSLLFLDLDYFKNINDRHGHSVGDNILRELSNTLKNHESEVVKAYRYGGEEFAVLIQGIAAPVAYSTAEKIRSAVAQDQKLQDPIKGLTVTVSIGVSSYPDLGNNEKEVIENADFAMYYSKSNGRNLTNIYTEQVRHFFVNKKGTDLNKTTQLNAVKMLSTALEAKDSYTSNHSISVMEYAIQLGRKIKLNEHLMEILESASLLHDCGKIGISDDVLFKPGTLTDKEYLEVKKHPSIGHNIVSNLQTSKEVQDAILYHHESWDGSGYPCGLKGHEIPLLARVITIADAYQAMTSDRPYRKAMSKEEAIAEISRCKAKQFDPQLADLFLEIIDSIKTTKPSKFMKEVEELVDTKNDNMTAAYGHGKHSIAVIDLAYKITFVNDNALNIIGKDEKEILGARCYATVIGRALPCEGCKIAEVVASKATQSSFRHEITVNGVSRNVEQLWIPILDDANEVQKIVEVVFDS